VVVSSSAKRGWEVSTCSVDGLPLVFEVNPTGNFGDQDRGQVLCAVLFVNAQIVDLSHLDLVVLDAC
jgi:hypothetical protein